MPTVNEGLVEEAIAHQINLAKYNNGVVQRIIRVLNRLDGRLIEAIKAVLERLSPDSFTIERLESLLGSVRAANSQAFAQIEATLNAELVAFVDYEAAYLAKMLEAALPVQVSVAAVSVDQVYTAALARPFQGALLKGFLADLEASRAKRVRMTIAQGYVESKTTDEIVRELRGTQARGFKDGAFEVTRRNAEAVTRTALSHMAGVTRDRFHDENSDLIKAVTWTSTLDARTTPICRLRDGMQYTNDTHKPIGHQFPWLGGPGRAHWNCRSTSVPVVKSFEELGLNILDFKPSTRASMDGQVPATMTYGEWLKSRSAAKQDEILGPTRGRLFRAGKLTLDQFHNDKGDFLTLEQLRQREGAAFARAGL